MLQFLDMPVPAGRPAVCAVLTTSDTHMSITPFLWRTCLWLLGSRVPTLCGSNFWRLLCPPRGKSFTWSTDAHRCPWQGEERWARLMQVRCQRRLRYTWDTPSDDLVKWSRKPLVIYHQANSDHPLTSWPCTPTLLNTNRGHFNTATS